MKGKEFKLKTVQLEKIYMGKVTNQDGCHTINRKNDGNWKYFLNGHVVYQNEGNTNSKWFKHIYAILRFLREIVVLAIF